MEAPGAPDLRPRGRRLHAGLRRAGPAPGCASTTVDRRDDAQPLPDPLPPGHAGGDRALQRLHRRRTLWFFTRAGYSGRPGAAAMRRRTSPATRPRTGPAPRPRVPAPDMLNRGDRRRLGLRHRHRRLLRRHQPADHQGALHPLGGVGGAHARSSGCTARAAGDARPWTFDPAVRVYRSLSKLHLRAALADHAAVAAAPARPGSPRPARCGSPTPATGAPRPAGPGVDARPTTCSCARWSAGRHSRRVYFPSGCWKAAGALKRYGGRSSAVVGAPLSKLPYFERCGTHPLRRD